jgi:hypothetical protein
LHDNRDSADIQPYFTSDVCVTVHRWYNNINNQLDATKTVY